MRNILNFYQSTENIGTSGQPSRGQFQTIFENGYTSVVNLAVHDSENAIPEEGGIVSALGMSYFHMPVPFDKPTAEHVRKFMRLMNVLEGEKVFVHCAVNARVSAFMFKYLTLAKHQCRESSTSPILQQWLPKMDDNWRSILDLSAEELV